jgi:hypothetical protein
MRRDLPRRASAFGRTRFGGGPYGHGLGRASPDFLEALLSPFSLTDIGHFRRHDHFGLREDLYQDIVAVRPRIAFVQGQVSDAERGAACGTWLLPEWPGGRVRRTFKRKAVVRAATRCFTLSATAFTRVAPTRGPSPRESGRGRGGSVTWSVAGCRTSTRKNGLCFVMRFSRRPHDRRDLPPTALSISLEQTNYRLKRASTTALGESSHESTLANGGTRGPSDAARARTFLIKGAPRSEKSAGRVKRP